MPTHTPVRSWPATAMGALCAIVTARILLDDVAHGAPFGTGHLASLTSLAVAVAAGHMAWPAVRSGAAVSGLLLGLVFVVATGITVLGAGMRNAATEGARSATAGQSGTVRAETERMRREALYILEACPAGTPRDWPGIRCGLRAARDAECATGKGRACDGKSYTVTTYEAAIDSYDRRLAKVRPEPGPSEGYAHAGRVLAALPLVAARPDAIAARLEMVLPFAATAVAELATIAFLGFGLSGAHDQARTMPDRPAHVRTGPQAPRRTAAPARPPAAPSAGPSDRPGAKARDAALADLLTMLAMGQSAPSQRALAERWSRPKQTVSDWLRSWEADGTIPVRRARGREKAVPAAIPTAQPSH